MNSSRGTGSVENESRFSNHSQNESRLTNHSTHGSRNSSYGLNDENIRKNMQVLKARSRPIKMYETEPFLSVDLLPSNKVCVSPEPTLSCDKPRTRSMLRSHTVHSPLTTASITNSFSQRGTPDNKVKKNEELERSDSNVHIKQPFKHSVSRPSSSPGTQDQSTSPSKLMKARTKMATSHINKILNKHKQQDIIKTKGRLLKGRLKPMNPVVPDGPGISNCRGVLSDATSYSPSPSRTLQRRREIVSSMNHGKIPCFTDRPVTEESVHQTSIASSEACDSDRLEDTPSPAVIDLIDNIQGDNSNLSVIGEDNSQSHTLNSSPREDNSQSKLDNCQTEEKDNSLVELKKGDNSVMITSPGKEASTAVEHGNISNSHIREESWEDLPPLRSSRVKKDNSHQKQQHLENHISKFKEEYFPIVQRSSDESKKKEEDVPIEYPEAKEIVPPSDDPSDKHYVCFSPDLERRLSENLRISEDVMKFVSQKYQNSKSKNESYVRNDSQDVWDSLDTDAISAVSSVNHVKLVPSSQDKNNHNTKYKNHQPIPISSYLGNEKPKSPKDLPLHDGPNKSRKINPHPDHSNKHISSKHSPEKEARVKDRQFHPKIDLTKEKFQSHKPHQSNLEKEKFHNHKPISQQKDLEKKPGKIKREIFQEKKDNSKIKPFVFSKSSIECHRSKRPEHKVEDGENSKILNEDSGDEDSVFVSTRPYSAITRQEITEPPLAPTRPKSAGLLKTTKGSANKSVRFAEHLIETFSLRNLSWTEDDPPSENNHRTFIIQHAESDLELEASSSSIFSKSEKGEDPGNKDEEEGVKMKSKTTCKPPNDDDGDDDDNKEDDDKENKDSRNSVKFASNPSNGKKNENVKDNFTSNNIQKTRKKNCETEAEKNDKIVVDILPNDRLRCESFTTRSEELSKSLSNGHDFLNKNFEKTTSALKLRKNKSSDINSSNFDKSDENCDSLRNDYSNQMDAKQIKICDKNEQNLDQTNGKMDEFTNGNHAKKTDENSPKKEENSAKIHVNSTKIRNENIEDIDRRVEYQNPNSQLYKDGHSFYLAVEDADYIEELCDITSMDSPVYFVDPYFNKNIPSQDSTSTKRIYAKFEHKQIRRGKRPYSAGVCLKFPAQTLPKRPVSATSDFRKKIFGEYCAMCKHRKTLCRCKLRQEKNLSAENICKPQETSSNSGKISSKVKSKKLTGNKCESTQHIKEDSLNLFTFPFSADDNESETEDIEVVHSPFVGGATFEALDAQLREIQNDLQRRIEINEPKVKKVSLVEETAEEAKEEELSENESFTSSQFDTIDQSGMPDYQSLLAFYRKKCSDSGSSGLELSRHIATKNKRVLLTDVIASPIECLNRIFNSKSSIRQKVEEVIEDVKDENFRLRLNNLASGCFLQLVCDFLPEVGEEVKQIKQAEIFESNEDRPGSGLEVIATRKTIYTPKGERVEDEDESAAPFPPLCFTINARPPPGSVYYFSYGTDMNPKRLGMYVRREIEKRSWGILFGFNMLFNKRGAEGEGIGFPNIEFNPFGSVEGCVYELKDSELYLLDSCVGYPEHYEHIVVPVWMTDGEDGKDGLAKYCVPAVTYIAQDKWVENEKYLPCDFSLSQCLKGSDILTPDYVNYISKMADIRAF